MKIGIAGPMASEYIKDLVGTSTRNLPRGYAGAPFLSTLTRALLARGHEVSCYSTTSDMAIKGDQFVSAHNGNFRIYLCAARRRSFALEDGRVGRMVDFFRMERANIVAAIHDDKPDVVHSHWLYEFALSGLASNLPCVVTIHDSPFRVLKYYPNLYRLGRALMALRTLRAAKFLTAVSPYVAEQVMWFARAPIAIIPNPMPEISNPKLGLSVKTGTAPIIAMVNNGWGRLKNPERGLAAFQRLRERYPNAKMRLFGSDFGPGEKAEQYAAARGLKTGIEFVGSVPHAKLMEELKRTSVLLHPAYEEACPLTLIEAMANGVPIVAGQSSGGVPWVLGYGSCGVLTDISSVESMSSSLYRLISNPELLETLRASGFARAQSFFSSAVVASGYEEQYRNAMSGF